MARRTPRDQQLAWVAAWRERGPSMRRRAHVERWMTARGGPESGELALACGWLKAVGDLFELSTEEMPGFLVFGNRSSRDVPRRSASKVRLRARSRPNTGTGFGCPLDPAPLRWRPLMDRACLV